MSIKLGNFEICNVGFGTGGLMFRKKIDKPIIFVLNKENFLFIHTFFVRFPIDVLFLDSNKRVIKKKRMMPWRILLGKAKYIIEGKKGSFEKIRIGEKVEFKKITSFLKYNQIA